MFGKYIFRLVLNKNIVLPNMALKKLNFFFALYIHPNFYKNCIFNYKKGEKKLAWFLEKYMCWFPLYLLKFTLSL